MKRKVEDFWSILMVFVTVVALGIILYIANQCHASTCPGAGFKPRLVDGVCTCVLTPTPPKE